MAKEKDKAATAVAPTNLMEYFVDSQRAKYKTELFGVQEQFNRMVGIEHYSLAFQYLIHSNIIPLQSIVTLAAPPKTYKTSALLEMMRVFMSPHIAGRAFYLGTEGKLGPYKIRSILRESCDHLHIQQTATTNEWVEVLGEHLETIHKIMTTIATAKTAKGKLSTEQKNLAASYLSPIVLGVDSLSGNQSESMAGKVQHGEVGKTFSDRPILVTQFLNVWSSALLGLPVTIFLINHEKKDMEGNKTTPGGVAPAFHTSLDIRCSRGAEKSYGGARPTTVTELWWTVRFSSIGRDGRRIMIPYVDQYDDHEQQICYFDWDAALTYLLIKLPEEDKEFAESLEPFTITPVAAGNRGTLYLCPRIGVPDKETALEVGSTAQYVGRKLQTEHRAELAKALRIQQYAIWTPDYSFPMPKPIPDKPKPPRAR